MAKGGTDWFPHDYAPTSDPKMQAFLGEHGAIGYGLYWRVTEMLHTEPEHALTMKPYLFLAIGKQMLLSSEQVEKVLRFAIEVCELFKTDGELFWSDRVNRNLDDRFRIRQELHDVRSAAGKLGAQRKWQKYGKTDGKIANAIGKNGKAMAVPLAKMANDGYRTGQDRTGQLVYPLAILRSDESWWEQAVAMKFSRANERAESWESWYVNKFEWKNKNVDEIRKSLIDWLKNPKGMDAKLSGKTDYKI